MPKGYKFGTTEWSAGVKIAFAGGSHLCQTLRRVAQLRGLDVVASAADLFFVAEDVLDHGDLVRPHAIFEQLLMDVQEPVVLVSQVPPGTTRRWAAEHSHRVYYQVDTIIMRSALTRAYAPEQLVVGCAYPKEPLPLAYQEYLMAFKCPVWQVSYETAELAKCAINYVLAKQIEAANDIAAAARNVGADYHHVEVILRTDARIGPRAYLRPGKTNQHLDRDVATVRRLQVRSGD